MMKYMLFVGLLQLLNVQSCQSEQTTSDEVVRTGRRLTLRTAGGLTTDIDLGNEIAAVISDRSHGPGMHGHFCLTEQEVEDVDLRINQLMPAQQASALPATITLTVHGVAYQSTECVASVNRQTFEVPGGGAIPTGRSYLVEGQVQCHSELVAREGNLPGITVENLSFAMSVAWDRSVSLAQ